MNYQKLYPNIGMKTYSNKANTELKIKKRDQTKTR